MTAKMVTCDACGEEVPYNETKTMQIRTCCSMIKQTVCKTCWDKAHGKNRQ